MCLCVFTHMHTHARAHLYERATVSLWRSEDSFLGVTFLTMWMELRSLGLTAGVNLSTEPSCQPQPLNLLYHSQNVTGTSSLEILISSPFSVLLLDLKQFISLNNFVTKLDTGQDL